MKSAFGELTEEKEYTFQEVAQNWLKNVMVMTKESTYAKYSVLLRIHLLPELGELKVNEIRPAILERYLNKKWREGRLDGTGPLSPSTVRLLACILQSILRFAKQMGYTELVYGSISKPKLVQNEMELFTTEEQRTLEEYIYWKKELGTYGIYICLYTGLRLGEICALTWGDVYLEHGYLKVRKTLQRIQVAELPKSPDAPRTKILVDIPKSKTSLRDIPLTPSLQRMLSGIRRSSSAASYVLTGETGRYMDPRTYQKRFRRYLIECGLKPRNFHTLRHQFASNCIALGVDVKSLSEILGHSNVNITLNRYVHSSMELKRTQLNKLDPAGNQTEEWTQPTSGWFSNGVPF